MSKRPLELYQLVYEDKLRAMAEPGAIDVLMRIFDDILKAFGNWQDNSLKTKGLQTTNCSTRLSKPSSLFKNNCGISHTYRGCRS